MSLARRYHRVTIYQSYQRHRAVNFSPTRFLNSQGDTLSRNSTFEPLLIEHRNVFIVSIFAPLKNSYVSEEFS